MEITGGTRARRQSQFLDELGRPGRFGGTVALGAGDAVFAFFVRLT
jgi:hypothetical protein